MSEERWRLEREDALDFMRALPANSVRAVVTDPPYCPPRDTRVHIDRSKQLLLSLDLRHGPGEPPARSLVVLRLALRPGEPAS